jgi:hypothetical protein
MRIPKPFLLRPLIRPAGPQSSGAAIVTLNFAAEEQSQSNWCWAAVATSVGLFYGTGNWTQCAVATAQVNALLDPGGNHDCCNAPGSSTCNQYGFLNPALHHVNAYNNATSGKASAVDIFSRISEWREVVCVRVAWFGGGAHFTTIHGFTDPSSGGDIYLTVSDTIPGWGTTTMLYSNFPQEYQRGGEWTDTYWTKNAFGPSREYAAGERTAVALDNNSICVSLNVHSTQISSQVGHVDFITQNINWGPAVAYGSGDSVAIDVDDIGRCVGVHTDAGRLHYRVGAINTYTLTIDWGASAQYGNGVRNDISLTWAGACLSVHVESERLYYRMGWLNDDQSIGWMPQVEYGAGLQNSIAVDEKFNCIDVHVGAGLEDGRIFYRVGRLDIRSGAIRWGPRTEFEVGSNVDISLDNNLNCRAVLVDNGTGVNTLVYRCGIVDTANQTIEWAPRTDYASGEYSSVGLDDSGKSVEVHAAGGRLYNKVGR